MQKAQILLGVNTPGKTRFVRLLISAMSVDFRGLYGKRACYFIFPGQSNNQFFCPASMHHMVLSSPYIWEVTVVFVTYYGEIGDIVLIAEAKSSKPSAIVFL